MVEGFSNLKIGFLTDTYPSYEGAGGIGTYTETVARYLRDMGAEVHIFLQRGHRSSPRLEMVEGISVWSCPAWAHRRNMSPRSATRWSLSRLDSSYLVRFSVAAGVDVASRNRPFDVLESPDFGALGGLCKERTRRRFAVRLHGPATLVLSPENVPWTTTNSPEKEVIAAADVVTSGTRSAVDIIEKHLDMHIEHPRLIPNPIPWPLEIPRRPLRRDALVCFGRLNVKKGYEVLLRAARQVIGHRKDLSVTFVGSDSPVGGNKIGNWSNEIFRTARELGVDDRVTIIPPKYGDDLISLIHEHAAVALPSLLEFSPIGAMEALAWGVPLITSSIPPFQELNVGGSLFTTTPTGDPSALAAAIDRTLENYDEARQRAQQARQYARNWLPEKVVPRLLEAWLDR